LSPIAGLSAGLGRHRLLFVALSTKDSHGGFDIDAAVVASAHLPA
jgi:hypothetical protein